MRIIITFVLVILFKFLCIAQCEEKCTKGFFEREIATENLIDCIESNDLNKVKRGIKKLGVLYRKDEEFIDRLDMGVGCYYYYYAYIKLMELGESNLILQYSMKDSFGQEFLDLKSRVPKYLEFADSISTVYKELDCENLKKIKNRYRKDVDSLKYKYYPDIRIDTFIVLPDKIEVGKSVEAFIKISNLGAVDIVDEIQVTWLPDSITSQKKIIEGLNSGESKYTTFMYSYQKEGIYTTSIIIDSRNLTKEFNEENNRKSQQIEVLKSPPPPPPPPPSKCVLVIQTMNKLGNIASHKIEIDCSKNEGNCIQLKHQFPERISSTSHSDYIDDEFLKNTLLPYIKERNIDLRNAVIRVIGNADGKKFDSTRPEQINIEIKDKRYKEYIFARNYEDINIVGSKIRNDKQLAFIRAYILKDKMMKIFDISPNQIDIIIKVHDGIINKPAARSSDLFICSDKFTRINIEELRNNIKKSLNGEPKVAKPNIKQANVETEGIDQKTTISGLSPIDVPINEIKKDDLKVGQIIRTRKIQFEANKAVLEKKSYSTLKDLIELLNSFPSLNIEVGGHTNTLCADEECNKLSENRALVVRQYLINNGIFEGRLEAKGYGKKYPIMENPKKSKNIREKNQRVEIKVLRIRV